MTELDSLRKILNGLGVSAEQLRVLASQLNTQPMTLREAFKEVQGFLPGWLRDDSLSQRRLLDGVPEGRGPGGALIPRIDALGEVSLDEFAARAQQHVDQVQRHVSATLRDAAAVRRSRYQRSTDPRDYGNSAAERSRGLVRGLAKVIRLRLHIDLPLAADVRFDGRRGEVHGFSRTELAAWPATLQQYRKDLVLDHLVLSFDLVTGARRNALFNLDVGDFDVGECRVTLGAKGVRHKAYWVPVHRSLILAIWELAAERGARLPADPAFLRVRSGTLEQRRLTQRYFNRLFDCLNGHQRISLERQHPHRLRHTAIDRVRHATGDDQISMRFGDHQPEHGKRVHYTYLDLPDTEFLAAMEAAFGPYADCPMPVASMLPPWRDGQLPRFDITGHRCRPWHLSQLIN